MASTFISLPAGAEITGPIDVIVNAANDSIRIADAGGDELAINADGSINVNTSGGVSNEYTTGESTSVAISGSATVVSQYFATAHRLRRVSCSGTNRAEYTLYFDASQIDKQRSTVAEVNCKFDYETGILIPADTTVTVEVLNAGTTTGDFNAILIYSPD